MSISRLNIAYVNGVTVWDESAANPLPAKIDEVIDQVNINTTDIDELQTYKDEVETLAANAATSEANAATSASNASISEVNAAISESNAATSEANAAISESNAATSAANAAMSESNAATSESSAAISESNAATSAANAATSESNAAISESNAATSESNAAASASAAAISEFNAATSESNTAASASAAAISESNAAASASSAATSESNAAAYANAASTSESNAATSASNAATSESNAASSASSAALSASNAATSESNAATSAANAAISESNAASSASQAFNSLYEFKGIYYGSFASDPTTDPNGNAMNAGDLYFNTTASVLMVYDGSSWSPYSPNTDVVWGSITGTLSNQTDLQTALNNKLDSSSYTASDVLTKIKTVDGSGSGLDADLLDGLNSSQFIRSDLTTTATSKLLVQTSTSNTSGTQYTYGQIEVRTVDNTPPSIGFHRSGYSAVALYESGGKLYTRNSSNIVGTVWTSATDGSGSGLDADKLDGLDSSSFVKTSSETISTSSPSGGVHGDKWFKV